MPQAAADPAAEFIALFERALAQGGFVRLVLSKPTPAAEGALRVTARPVLLKGAACVSFVQTQRTRDITHNAAAADAPRQVRDWLGTHFSHAHLFTSSEAIQLMISRKGRHTLLRSAAEAPPAPPAHDRAKHRFVDIDRPFLHELGVTDAQHRLVPAMARKWKQINKFVEVLAHALDASALKNAASLDVVDFGSGKGYLTFALHDHLCHTLGLQARVAGVELRPEMVDLCNGVVQRLHLDGLRFEHGDVRGAAPAAIDIMIALHACDTATDHAIHAGVRAGAAIIVCAPCCHKELRPQLLAPHPLRPILKHGVHLGQQAEMLTDTLRALLLEACGYDTQVFEFVALEHTQKNKMILAVRRAGARTDGAAQWQQIDELKGFYGIRDQCLQTLLEADRAAGPAPG